MIVSQRMRVRRKEQSTESLHLSLSSVTFFAGDLFLGEANAYLYHESFIGRCTHDKRNVLYPNEYNYTYYHILICNHIPICYILNRSNLTPTENDVTFPPGLDWLVSVLSSSWEQRSHQRFHRHKKSRHGNRGTALIGLEPIRSLELLLTSDGYG